nr:hypothetical protein [Acidithiobacillus ferruginosus]
MKKTKVAIIFGGKSAEHEVSLQSARNVFDAIDREKYDPVLIGIDKSGKWLLSSSNEYLLNADNPKEISLNGSGVCQGSCRVSHFLSGHFILPLRV